MKRFDLRVAKNGATGEQLELLPVADGARPAGATRRLGDVLGELLDKMGVEMAAMTRPATESWWRGCKWDD